MKLARRLFLILAFLSSNVLAVPRFEDFPAASYAGRRAAINLQGVKGRQYASQLRTAAGQAVNFAGRYVLTTWGCGASCIMGAAIDIKTGGVAWLPFTVCCWNLEITEPLEFRRDSRLLIVHGSLNEIGAGSATHYYDVDRGRFVKVTNVP